MVDPESAQQSLAVRVALLEARVRLISTDTQGHRCHNSRDHRGVFFQAVAKKDRARIQRGL